MEITTRATVRSWDDDQGWGVLDSDSTPGGCWTHFSALDFDGYRSMSVGDVVRLTAESPGQDGYGWRALRVHMDDESPASTGAVGGPAQGAYVSELSVAWDDG